MYSSVSQSNPFALLMDPEAVFRTLEKSDRLSALRRHVCRPLDKPTPVRPAESDIADFDDLVEASAELTVEDPLQSY